MPQIPESNAASIAQALPTAAPEDRGWMLDTLTQYQQQQADNGEPEWPSQVEKQRQSTQILRGLFTGGLDAAQLPVSPFSANPKRDKAIMANVQFLTARTGKTAQEIADRYDFYKGDYAAQKWQKTNIDDVGFYDAAAKEIQRDQQIDDTILEGAKAALRGEPIGAALQTWQQKNADRMPDSSQFMRGFMGARAKAGEHLQFADELMKLLESGSGMTKGDQLTGQVYGTEQAAQFEGMLSKLAEMKPKDRKQVYGILGAKAEAAGYDQKGFWAQMLGQIDKGLARAGSTLGTQAGVAGDVASNLPAMLSNTMKPEEFAATDASIAKRHAVGEVHDELARIVSGAIDPVKPTVGWLNDSVEKGLIQAPGAVLPFMAASAALGPWGAGALFTADFAEQNRRELRAQGIDNDKAIAIGAAAAPFQAAVESLSNTLQLGRFPAVQAALARFTKPIAGGAGLMTRYGMNSALSFGTEFTEEQLQDNVIRPAVQNVVAAFDQDVPQVGLGQIYENIKASSPELAFTLAPMALVFGGVMTGAQANLSSAMIDSQDLLEAAGYSASQANAIRSEATEEGKIAKAREFWLNREGTPKTMEDAAKSYSERIKLLQTDAAAAQADLEQRGVLPRMLHAADNRWRLTFNDGSTAEFNSHQEADAARWQWVTDKLGDMHASVRQQIAQMEKGADVGRELAVEFKPEERYATPEEMARPDFQARIKQGDILDNPDTAYHDSIAIGKATGEDEALPQILGSSVNEFKDGVLRTTVKLYEGANILTLVEEKLEGDAKAILSSQTGRDWMLQHLRAYEQASGDKLFAEADDGKLTDKMLVEAWSHLGQYYLVGNSKKGAALGAGGMRKMFADAVRAGLGGSLNAEAQFFGQVWQRASRLSKAKREGKLGADLVAELEKQLGIDSQVKHEQGAMQAAEDMGNEALNGIDLSTTSPTAYSEDNPGPNGETFSARKFNFASQLAPAAQTMQQMRQKGATVDFAKAYQAAAVGQSTAMLSLDAIYKQALAQNPKLTEADFGKQVQALYNSGYLMLEPGESAQTMRDTLNRFGVKDSLGIPSMFAAPMQAQQGQTYSIRPGDYESRITAAFSPFQRDPELRLRVAQVAKARAQRLGAEWLEKAAVLRAAKDINRESRVREALAYDDKVKAYLDALTPEARQELEQDFAGLESDPLIAAMLDHGRLMSFTTAKKLGKVEAKSGDYDNVPFLPRSWYSKGAGIMPDQMAQAMYDAGLLKDGYSDTLWKELTARLESHAKNKAAYDKAQADFKAAEKQARADAKAESEAWATAERKKATSPKSQREMLKGALRTLDGILSAAPPEVRVRVGGYVKLAGLATDEAMLDEIERRIAKLNTELEKWLKKEGRGKLEKLFSKAAPKKASGEKAVGKLGAESHAWLAFAEHVSSMSPAEVDGAIDALEKALESDVTAEQKQDLSEWVGRQITDDDEARDLQEERLTILRTFGSVLYGTPSKAVRGSDDVFNAIEVAQEQYAKGRLGWIEALAAKREKNAALRADAQAGLDAVASDEAIRKQMAKDAKAAGLSVAVTDYIDSALDLSGFFRSLLGDGSAYHHVRQAYLTSDAAEQDAMRERRRVFFEMLKDVFGKGQTARLRGLWDLQKIQDNTPLGTMSQLQAVQYTLWHMDPDSQEWLADHGYGPEWQAKAEAWLTPEAKKIRSWLSAQYNEQYFRINPVFRKLKGVNLPRVENYGGMRKVEAMGKSESGVALSPDDMVGGMDSGFTKTRVSRPTGMPRPTDALVNYWSNAFAVEHYIAWAETTAEMRAVIGHRDFRLAVQSKLGKTKSEQVQNWIQDVEMGGQRDAAANSIFGHYMQRMNKAASASALLLKIGTIVKQFPAVFGSAFKVGLPSYLKSLGRIAQGQGSISLSDAWKSNAVQRRIDDYSVEMREAFKGHAKRRFENEVLDVVTQFPNRILDGGWYAIGYADALFTTVSAAVAHDVSYLEGKDAGLSDDEATKYAEMEMSNIVKETAQPDSVVTKSQFENRLSNSLMKLIFAFQSANRQAVGLSILSIRHGDKVASRLTLGHIVIPLVVQTIGNIMQMMFTDKDDDEIWTMKGYLTAMALGPWSGALQFGPFLEMAASKFAGVQPRMATSPAYEASKAVEGMLDGDISEKDIENIMTQAGNLLGGRFGALGPVANVVKQVMGLTK